MLLLILIVDMVLCRAFTAAILVPDVAGWVLLEVSMDLLSAGVLEGLGAGLCELVLGVEVSPVAHWVGVRHANL